MLGGEQSLGADPGIVDEAVDRAEFVAQALDESRNGVGLAQVESPEVKTAAVLLDDDADGVAQGVAFAARHRDHIIAGHSQPLRDGKADAAASTGDHDIMHLIAPAFPPP